MTTTDTPAALDKPAIPAAEPMPTEAEPGYFARLAKDLRRDYLLYLMLLPMLIWLVLFAYKPMYGLQMAFQKYSTFKGIAGSPYVGFDNFVVLFQSDQFLRALGNTLILGLYSMVFGFPVPIILAVMINEVYSARYRKTIQDHRVSAALHLGGHCRRHRYQLPVAGHRHHQQSHRVAGLRADLLHDQAGLGAGRSTSPPRCGRRPASTALSISRPSWASTRRSTNRRRSMAPAAGR